MRARLFMSISMAGYTLNDALIKFVLMGHELSARRCLVRGMVAGRLPHTLARCESRAPEAAADEALSSHGGAGGY